MPRPYWLFTLKSTGSMRGKFANQCSIEPPAPQPAFEPWPGLCRPASWKRGACLMRRPQISELIKSSWLQSGPNSRITTFLPARASTSAKIAPVGPAPTMATSTFSCVAMSPPRLRQDVGHVGDAQALEALDRAVDRVDAIVAEDAVDLPLRRPLPVFVPGLPQESDELALLFGAELGKFLAVLGPALAVDLGKRSAIKVHERRPRIGDAQCQQGFVRRHRALLIDEMRDAGLPGARHHGFAESLQRLCVVGAEHLERYALSLRLARRQQNFDAADRERQCADRGAFHERAAFDGIHLVLPCSRS